MKPEDRTARQKEVERGHHAKRILDDPLYVTVWEDMENALLKVMTAPQTSNEELVKARDGLIILKKLQAKFAECVRTAEMAQQQLESKH